MKPLEDIPDDELTNKEFEELRKMHIDDQRNRLVMGGLWAIVVIVMGLIVGVIVGLVSLVV